MFNYVLPPATSLLRHGGAGGSEHCFGHQSFLGLNSGFATHRLCVHCGPAVLVWVPSKMSAKSLGHCGRSVKGSVTATLPFFMK